MLSYCLPSHKYVCTELYVNNWPFYKILTSSTIGMIYLSLASKRKNPNPKPLLFSFLFFFLSFFVLDLNELCSTILHYLSVSVCVCMHVLSLISVFALISILSPIYMHMYITIAYIFLDVDAHVHTVINS